MHFPHILLKATKEINLDFDMSEAMSDIEIPEESKKKANEYMASKKLDDEMGYDSAMVFEKKLIFSFDYLYNNRKLDIPELNPVSIFYANAVMSLRGTLHYREELFKKSPQVGETGIKIHPGDFGNFFTYAINCIINLQASLESFANSQIPYEELIDENGDSFDPPVSVKLFVLVPKAKGYKTKKYNSIIEQLIQLRNKIIHLKPEQETNTAYKNVYRKLLKFDYEKAAKSTRLFINHYQSKLIEECECGVEFFYKIDQVKKNEEGEF